MMMILMMVVMSIDVQTKQMYCTTNSASHHRLLLKIVHVIHIQTTEAVSLIPTVLGECYGARMNIVLSANQVPIIARLTHK